MRPAYTARRREALHIVRAADGALEVGCGRLRILPGAVPYFRGVAAALGCMVDLPGAVEALDRGDALGRPVTIMQPPAAAEPPNAWAMRDADGGRIFYDPADWPRPGDREPLAAPHALLKLLTHADGSAASLPAVEAAAAGGDERVRLTCRPSKVGDALSFPCMIENAGPGAAYVMEAVTSRDPATRAACAAMRPAVTLDADGEALVGLFVPPRPLDRLLAAPVVPLARVLPAGGVLERRFEIPAPYAEASPWLPEPSPSELDAADVKGVSVAVAWWPADAPGMAATEAAFAPGLHAVPPSCAGALARLRFPVNGLRFGRRARG